MARVKIYIGIVWPRGLPEVYSWPVAFRPLHPISLPVVYAIVEAEFPEPLVLPLYAFLVTVLWYFQTSAQIRLFRQERRQGRLGNRNSEGQGPEDPA